MARFPHLAVPLRAVLAAAALGCLASFTFLGALHAPHPHGLDLALVGTPDTTGVVAAHLEADTPGAFDITFYETSEDAEQAVRDRDVTAAYVPGPQPELLLAGANGAMQASTLTAIFDAAARDDGADLAVHDVAPVPADDRAGLSPFLLVVSLTIPALVLAVLITLLGERAGLGPRVRLAAALVGAVAVGLVNTGVADGALDTLTGHYWQVSAVAALTVFAMTSAALALHRLFGPAGLAAAFALFLVVGMPATGAAVGPAYLPGFFRAVTMALPTGEAVPAVRSVQYFDGAASAASLWLLAAWGVAGAALLVWGPRIRAQRAGAHC
ncbi:MAG TPA: hypothetical protein VFV89_00595 [Nocardioides sp.]|uniref:hypothetical protein n=1 Tax=Nocardioides sp. TaxID=35761 RepID=UPI002E30ABAA|nr:hypothetical protein [Nocardioides sp.]HEX5086276.1 hypothetical protein [Nocardioides sp.]